MMQTGIYESLVTQLINEQLKNCDGASYFIEKVKLDHVEASTILTRHLSYNIQAALNLIVGELQIEQQIDVANKMLLFLKEELKRLEFQPDLIALEGEILKALFAKVDAHFSDFKLYLKEIYPYTRLSQSELFTGGNVGLSMESELKKEIRSSDQIDLLISFIKFKGVIILYDELKDFTERGGKLRVITTTYMGASDFKAIKLLSQLKNTEVKISYNSGNERLHAKAYLFRRNTGFNTGYIGSSNFSRSALTDGLEWNIKITTSEIPHIISKFQKTFDSYWESQEFEYFSGDEIQSDKLIKALNISKVNRVKDVNLAYFDIKPYPYQEEILEKLEVERDLHFRFRNLVVAATGTGKTVVAAFDYSKFRRLNSTYRLLFIAHRKEILEQARLVFQGILKDSNFGELWVDGYEPVNYEYVFASVQTLNNRIDKINLSPNYYDFVIIDECHHLTASSYRGIIQYFNPKVLLGLTATPERMDGGDISEDFHNRIAAEIRLPEALNRKLLCPFQYFGITDSVDLKSVGWERGRYVSSELSDIYTSNDRRVNEIILALDRYTKDMHDVRAIGFCVTIDHAKFMAQKFSLAGFRASYLTSENSNDRELIRQQLKVKKLNYLFVVDIFNEGVDIPEIDTVLFLRPTESLTVFLQQLGRGLRLAEGKENLTVLDFVANGRPEYKFENKFRALIGPTLTTVIKEVEDNFPHLPLGCSIVLERKAKQIIIDNIRSATEFGKSHLVNKIRHFIHNSLQPLTLKNFTKFESVPLPLIYSRGGWSRLCQLAGRLNDFNEPDEKQIISAIKSKWLSTRSRSYFEFILKLAKAGFEYDFKSLTKTEELMLLMLHFDIWQSSTRFSSIEESIRAIGRNYILINEIIELLELLIDQIDFKEIDANLPYEQPLKVHARYTREQILAALGFSTFLKRSSNREGVAENKSTNTECLFINLVKSKEDFSPTTMYDDYAINDFLFHWQSQNAAGPNTTKGKSYIHHFANKKVILLFVRERAKDQYGNTMGYVFIGKANFEETYGSKPMSIKWRLEEPLPHYLWKDAAKLVAG